MFHKIDKVEPLEDYKLKVTFKDKTIKIYNAKDIVGDMDRDMFIDVHADIGGYGLVWDDDTDVWCNEVYEYGK